MKRSRTFLQTLIALSRLAFCRIVCRLCFTTFVVFAVLIQFCFCCNAAPLTSWNLVLSNSPAGITSMAYGNGTFIGVGGGFDFISHDGSNWTVSETAPIINTGAIAYGKGMFVAFGTNNQYKANYVLQSTNGTTWTAIYTSSNTLFSAAYGNNTWVLIGANDIATATLTSSNWNWSEFQPSFSPAYICYANGNFVISALIGGYSQILSSPDGLMWQYDSQASIGGQDCIVFGNGKYSSFVLNGGSIWFSTSSDLINWSPYSSFSVGGSVGGFAIGYYGNEFVLAIANNYNGSGGTVATSTDGTLWQTNGTMNFGSGSIISLAFGQGTLVTATAKQIYQSGVFVTQSNVPTTTLGISTYPGVIINGTAGAVYQIQYTTSLNSTWQTLTNFMLPYSPYIWIDTSSTVTGQKFYRSVQLQ